jgi:hypothetical protein
MLIVKACIVKPANWMAMLLLYYNQLNHSTKTDRRYLCLGEKALVKAAK